MSYVRLAKRSQQLSLVLLLMLIAYLSLLHILRGQDILFRWVVSCVPLLGFLPGLIRAQFRTGSWLCFVLLIYFTGFTAALGVPGNTWGDALGLTLTVSLFISSMLFSRWQQRAGDPSND